MLRARIVGWRRAGALRGKREEERVAEPFVRDVRACYPVRHENESKYTRRFAGSHRGHGLGFFWRMLSVSFRSKRRSFMGIGGGYGGCPVPL